MGVVNRKWEGSLHMAILTTYDIIGLESPHSDGSSCGSIVQVDTLLHMERCGQEEKTDMHESSQKYENGEGQHKK